MVKQMLDLLIGHTHCGWSSRRPGGLQIPMQRLWPVSLVPDPAFKNRVVQDLLAETAQGNGAVVRFDPLRHPVSAVTDFIQRVPWLTCIKAVANGRDDLAKRQAKVPGLVLKPL